jgi:tripartite ATP-independent transporter DctM subunit
MIFAGMAGSAVADAAGRAPVEVRAMKKAGYRPETAAAISSAAATIGPIIPPSLPMVIYGVSADTSIGRLFLAGVIPGVLMGISLMIMVAIIAPRQGLPRHSFGGLCDVWAAFKDTIWALLAPVILLGGMFSGLFTPTEAAAVADLYALFLGFVVYRTLRIKDLPAILINTAETTGIVMVLVMVAGALGWCMSISRIPQSLTPIILATIHEPLVFLFAANVILLVIGCFMEALAALLILIPILVLARQLRHHRSVRIIMIFNLVLGTIHPPIGVVLLVMAHADVIPGAIARSAWLVPLLSSWRDYGLATADAGCRGYHGAK